MFALLVLLLGPSRVCDAQPEKLAAPPKALLQELGPRGFRFLGTTRSQSKFDLFGEVVCVRTQPREPQERFLDGDPPLDVLCLIVDTKDFRFTGPAADRTTYRNARHAAYQNPCHTFWKESSFGNITVNIEMPDEVQQLPGAFNDYYNRPFAPASLETRGLAAAVFPLAFSAGDSAVLTVTDSFNRITDITLTPPGTVATLGQLQALWSTACGSVGLGADFVTCTQVGPELRFSLRSNLVAEGSSIRVKGGSVLGPLGLQGPKETPGAGSGQASLEGRPVPGGFPLTLAAAVSVNFEVRDNNLRTRQYVVNVPAGTYADPAALAAPIVTALNVEFPWVESFAAGADRLGLRVVAGSSGPTAAVRLVGAANPANLGLNGPVRIDGVVNEYASNGIRGDSAIPMGEAVSSFLAKRAAAAGIPIEPGRAGDLTTLANNELGKFDCIMLLLMDVPTGMPGNKRAWMTYPTYNVRLEGAGGFAFVQQRHSASVISEGSEGWQTIAHEFGHSIGCWDLYDQPEYDPQFVRDRAYTRAWSVMDYHPAVSHLEGWHKNRLGFVSAGVLRDVFPPPPGATEHHRFTLIPLEYPEADYSDFGDAAFPKAQVVRVHLSKKHWLGLENRQPGAVNSQALPDDVHGVSPAVAPGRPGGVLVLDAADPFVAYFRPPVSILNPSGAALAGLRQGRGLKAGDSLPFDSTFPRYDGLKLDVVEEVPGPVGKPEAYKVDLEWGPGDFLELEMRPWLAPRAYATPDIWVDWPGNGEEAFAGVDPPLGNGDAFHWHPDGSVKNLIKVRVHNRGTVLGKGVIVRTSVNDPIGMGDHGTFVPLPDSAPQDIPAGSSRDFAFDWFPKAKGHTCIRAVIFRHTSDLGDLDPENNAAQENVDEFSPSAGSPYEPYDFTFKVTNNQTRPVEAELLPSGLVEGMDLELEQKYLTLAPLEEVFVRGRLQLDTEQIPVDPGRRKSSYCFNIHAFKRTQDSLLPWGGVSISVLPGARSKLQFDEISRNADIQPPGFAVFGRLLGDFANSETVDAAVVASDGKVYQGTAKTNAFGRFIIPIGAGVPPGKANVMIYYNGTKMAASHLGPRSFTIP